LFRHILHLQITFAQKGPISKNHNQKAEYLAPKEDDEVDGWLSGRNMHQKHLELSWYPDERI